mgnify:CR=1 FL=1
MRETRPTPTPLVSTPVGWLDALLKCRTTLEEVNKALEDYLETKRTAFPRCGTACGSQRGLSNRWGLTWVALHWQPEGRTQG